MAAKNRVRVYLGFDDEYVRDKHRQNVNFTTNKIGGHPNWHTDAPSLSPPKCKLCGYFQLLVLQIYAPLEDSKYHRTLYIFACIKSNCWNQNESWTCLRVQSVDNTFESDDIRKNIQKSRDPSTVWLAEADNWDDHSNDKFNEYETENKSETIKNNVNEAAISLSTPESSEGEYLKDELMSLKLDDPNANCLPGAEYPVAASGAVGKVDPSTEAYAEIDGEETDVVRIDIPTKPRYNLFHLLNESAMLPVVPGDDIMGQKFSFHELFLSVEEEEEFATEDVPLRVRELMAEYKRSNCETIGHRDVDEDVENFGGGEEKYEKGVPIHGDELSHAFITRIQKNPGQILRYARDNRVPLLLSPINTLSKCKYCGEDLLFEVQVLPTIIPKLILMPRINERFQLEFGTVLIFTCSKSCWSTLDYYKDERVLVQAERL